MAASMRARSAASTDNAEPPRDSLSCWRRRTPTTGTLRFARQRSAQCKLPYSGFLCCADPAQLQIPIQIALREARHADDADART
jgi:hypothetical protein